MDDLAYIVENDVILEAIRRRLSTLSEKVEVRYQTSAKSYIVPGSTPGHEGVDQNTWVTIETDKGNIIQTKLLVNVLFTTDVNDCLFVYIFNYLLIIRYEIYEKLG